MDNIIKKYEGDSIRIVFLRHKKCTIKIWDTLHEHIIERRTKISWCCYYYIPPNFIKLYEPSERRNRDEKMNGANPFITVSSRDGIRWRKLNEKKNCEWNSGL